MYYIVVTNSVYSDKTLQDGAKLLYGLILSLSQKDGYCYAENSYLAETLNKETRTIQLYLSALKRKQYIYVKVLKSGLRMITTQDTRVKIAPAPKKPLEVKKRVNRQIAQEPEWLQEFIDDLSNMN